MWEYFMYTYGNQFVLFCIAAIFGCLGFMAKRVLEKLLEDKTVAAVASTAVQYVEQAYKDLHGEEKLAQALQAAETLLAEKGIQLTTEQLTVYIEAALAGFNKAFEKSKANLDSDSTGNAGSLESEM